jgi:putative phosphoribosyl transferase
MSSRNRFVARRLQRAGLATLLFDLLTEEEEVIDEMDARFRFDIPLLARRLVGTTDWALDQPELRPLRIGYFGASTGAAAALVAAAERPSIVEAVVSRGGRPDLAESALGRVRAPTLFIVGGLDANVLQLNRESMQQMRAPACLEIVHDATHLFEEEGALERVADLASEWFELHLASGRAEART